MISVTRLCGRSLLKVSGRLQFESPSGTRSRNSSSDITKIITSKKGPTDVLNLVKIVDQKATVGIIDRPEKTVRHFKCPHCEFTHESKSTVKEHVISKHKSSPYVCPICQEGFTNIKILSKHVKTSHPDKPALKEPYEIVNVVANPKTKETPKSTKVNKDSTKDADSTNNQTKLLPEDVKALPKVEAKSNDSTKDADSSTNKSNTKSSTSNHQKLKPELIPSPVESPTKHDDGPTNRVSDTSVTSKPEVTTLKVTAPQHAVLNIEPPKRSVTSVTKNNVEAMKITHEQQEVLITTAPKTSLTSVPKPELKPMKVVPKHCEVLRVDTTAKPDKEQPKLEEKVPEKVSTSLIDITQAKLTPIQTLNTIWIRASSDEDICSRKILLAKSHPTFMENIYPMHCFNPVNIVRHSEEIQEAQKIDPIYRQKMLENGNKSNKIIETIYPMPSFHFVNFVRHLEESQEACKVDPIYRQKMLENGNSSKFFNETIYPMPSFHSANFVRHPEEDQETSRSQVDPIYRRKMLEIGNTSKSFIGVFYPMKSSDVSNICQDSKQAEENCSKVDPFDSLSSYIQNVKEMSVDFLKTFGLSLGMKK